MCTSWDRAAKHLQMNLFKMQRLNLSKNCPVNIYFVPKLKPQVYRTHLNWISQKKFESLDQVFRVSDKLVFFLN